MRKKISIGVLISIVVGIVGLLSDVLDIRDRLFPGVTSDTFTATEDGFQTVTQELDTIHAVRMLYREETSMMENGLIRLTSGEEVRVVLSEPYIENDIPKYVLISQRMDPDNFCHSCAADVDGAVFTKVDDEWFLDIAQRGFAQMGFFGIAPDAELIKIGPDKFGYLFYFPGGSTGLTYTDAYLVAPFGERIDLVFQERIQFDNEMGCQPDYQVECWGYTSKIRLIEGTNVSYYDLRLTTRGTNQLEDGSIIPYDRDLVYSFSVGENRYILVE